VAILLLISYGLVMLRSLPLVCALYCPIAGAVTLTAYADESAPYHFTEKGKTVGIATDLLRAACTAAKLDCKIIILPWARAFIQAKHQPNTLIFSIVRRPELEREFIWVSPVITEEMWLFGHEDAKTPANLQEVHAQRIGAINGGSAITLLRDAGVPGSAIDAANSIESNFKKFAVRRVDYVVDTEIRFNQELARYPLPFKAKKQIKLQDVTSYYAMNLNSDPATVRALRHAFDRLRANKTLEQITRQYAPRDAP
jgi:polar amino acid transport system substrate-binding protein